ncbi:amino acid ABC transporter permease [Quisquiliibacterium transsilvanicum]|uniref:Glutamate/aspartate transport system permease protein n=1 Tax=Quisquiliibacterium transsilvanicum TaxID=1549638 RepID=A0A7W8HIA9_9BURK|nr:amino acid ABC transporter permease [Quisquiliibacterium transsilvanicum]MBB5271793.1 glutamate/aspartate transport system permease protein [Quisquiliibacterium transsilvanicum]
MDLGIFLELNADGDRTWWQSLAGGLGWTLSTAVLAGLIAFFLGSVLGVVRTTRRKWLVRLGNAYVELFRNIPLIVQFFVWYFVVPGLIPAVKRWVITLDPTEHQFATAVVCLGLFTAARVSEQVRSGIQSLPGGQRSAGYALGLTEWQTYRHVLLPMAYRIVIPPLTSEAMNLIKNTAVAYSIGLAELFFRTREMGEMTFRYFEAFAAATLAYVAIAMAANRVMAWVERRVAVPGYIGGRK